MRTVIIEDEQNALVALQHEIEVNCPEIQVVGHADRLGEAIRLIKQQKPDLIFMDIQLKDGTGFEVLEAIQGLEFRVIFTTAYSDYALKAIQMSALDYLVKPVGAKALVNAVSKVSHIKSLSESSQQQQNLVASFGAKDQKISLHTADGLHFPYVRDIVAISSQGNYSEFRFQDKSRLLVAKTLAEYDDLLSDSGFIRIHRSHLINTEHLVRYINKQGGSVVLSNGMELPVSGPNKHKLINLYS